MILVQVVVYVQHMLYIVQCLTVYFFSIRILDNLPVVVPRQTREGSQAPGFEHGYRVGYKVRSHLVD
jgi:hypothetical protein